MSQADFYGTWRVLISGGTDFGIGTTVSIAGSEGDIDVSFDRWHEPAQSSMYDPDLDQVQVTYSDRRLMISRYVDADYRAIYGVMILQGEGLIAERLAVWMAEQVAAGQGKGEAATPQIDAASFEGQYLGRATADAQFGVGSSITIESGGGTLSVSNALGQAMPDLTDMKFNPATCSLQGELAGTQVTVQVSLAFVPDDGREHRFLYGLSLVGDPEQAGTFAAEDDGGGDGIPI